MIDVRGLTKRYGPFEAVAGVSFSVERGEIVGFLGPNGAGKTTTLRILTGFMPATGGTAIVAGHDVHREPLEVKRRVGYLPENAPLYPEMRVRSYLRYVAEVKGVSRVARSAEIERVTAELDQAPDDAHWTLLSTPSRRRSVSRATSGARREQRIVIRIVA